ncbi:MAG: hypothetical protein LBP92_15010 [Deltaproteobacteria bacterium]|nr:hypothetical protein [Deltaproteobacteria bacterium]
MAELDDNGRPRPVWRDMRPARKDQPCGLLDELARPKRDTLLVVGMAFYWGIKLAMRFFWSRSMLYSSQTHKLGGIKFAFA